MKLNCRIFCASLALLMLTSSIAYGADATGASRTPCDRPQVTRSAESPVFAVDDDALAVEDVDETHAIVWYDRSWDGRWMTVGYLAEHLDTTRLVYDDVWFLPPSIGLYIDDIWSDVDYPQLDWDDPVGTGTVAVYINYLTGEMIRAEIVVMGDVRGTGQFGISQLVTMADMLRHPEDYAPQQLWAADWTCDGKVDISDLIREARILRASQAPPIDAGDFVLAESVDEGLAACGYDVVAYIAENPQWNVVYYFEEEPFVTARGVRIGSSMSDVLQAYG